MDLGFSGKPPMGGTSYRGSSGVPPTSGGTVSSPPMGAPKGPLGRPVPFGSGFWAHQIGKFLEKYGYRYFRGYAMLQRVDPAKTRRRAQIANAYLEQYLPDWYYQPGWWNYEGWEQWAKQTSGQRAPSYDYAAYGFTLQCSIPPVYSNFKLGVFPPPPGYPAASPSPCGVGVNPFYANVPVGFPIPVGTTAVVEVSDVLPYSVSPRQGQIYKRWTRTTGTTAVMPMVGNIVLPMPDPAPWEDPWPATQMETQYGVSTRGRVGLRPYQVVSTDYAYSSGGGTTGPVDGTHNQLPPPRGTKEKKAKADYGAIGRAYGVVTEVQDFSDCLVKSIKAGAQASGVHLPHAPGRWDPKRAVWIAQNARNVDMSTFIECVATQKVADDLIGAASSNIDRRFREKGYLTGLRGINGGRPSGFATGPHQQAISQALSRRIR